MKYLTVIISVKAIFHGSINLVSQLESQIYASLALGEIRS